MRESRLVGMLEKQQQRKEVAREEAHKKLNSVNEEFGKSQGRVANAMAAAMQPFVGTVEDNIMCMLLPNDTCCVAVPVLNGGSCIVEFLKVIRFASISVRTVGLRASPVDSVFKF